MGYRCGRLISEYKHPLAFLVQHFKINTIDMTQSTQLNHISETSVPENLKPQPERSELHQDVNNLSNKLPFDPEALTKKYAEEREKRLRHNGGLEQ